MTNSGLLNSRGLPRARLLDTGPKARLLDYAPEPRVRLLDFMSNAPRREAARMVQSLARRGRGSDTEVAHVARGEIVVPRQLQNPEVLAALGKAAAAYEVPLEMLSVGNALNRINPATGAPEFGVMDWITGLFNKDSPKAPTNEAPKAPPAPYVPTPEADAADARMSYADVDFDPNGPAEWQVALRHPVDAIGAYLASGAANGQAARLFGSPNAWNNEGDAWRHARWNQLMTNFIGAERAKEFADAHEREGSISEGERLMDLKNNATGRSLPHDPEGHMNPYVALQNARKKGYLRTRPY